MIKDVLYNIKVRVFECDLGRYISTAVGVGGIGQLITYYNL